MPHGVLGAGTRRGRHRTLGHTRGRPLAVHTRAATLQPRKRTADEFIGDMSAALTLILLALVIAAGIYDFRIRRIPNWLSLSGLILGIGTNTLLFGGEGLRASLLGLGCALLVYAPLYLLRGMGAGDVKLMAAAGSIAGAYNWLGIFLVTAILGGVVSLVVIIAKKRCWQTLANVAVIGTELLSFRVPARSAPHIDVRNPETLRLPHGTVIAAGTVLFLLWNAFN